MFQVLLRDKWADSIVWPMVQNDRGSGLFGTAILPAAKQRVWFCCQVWEFLVSNPLSVSESDRPVGSNYENL